MPDNTLPDLVFLSPEWIADVRDRCARFKANPTAKNWGRTRDMLLQDAEYIPKLLDEIEGLRAKLKTIAYVTCEKECSPMSALLDIAKELDSDD